jgi:EmrB/QacA subfamily drug resistance transporter
MADQQKGAHRWWVLIVVSVAQLMVLLDTTIVNIALPDAQADLRFSDAGRQWVVTAYALAFGALLFVGGRLMSVLGERRTLLLGLIGFGVASAAGGAAPDFGLLVAARALQGVFAALLMPTTLAVLTNTFTDDRERGKAFGIFGSIAGAGASVGLLLGGVLTASVSWRWTLYVNLVFALAGAVGTLVFVRSTPRVRTAAGNRVDWAGTALSAIGSVSIVFGFSSAEQRGWASAITIVALVVGVAAYVAFFIVERIAAAPILPLRVILNRTRGGSLIVLFIAGAALYATFLFLTYYFQTVLGLNPILSGLAFLPQSLSSITVATLGGIFLFRRVSGRVLMPAGLIVAAVGLLLIGLVSPEGNYAAAVLPGLILLGAGLALAFTVAFGLGLAGVEPTDAGVASAAVNAVQQIGGSIGTALLSTVAAAVTAAALVQASAGNASASARQAAVQGYSIAFWISAAALLGAAVIAAVLVRTPKPTAIDVEQVVDGLEVTTALS